jgi:hypothetical protein
MKQDTLICNLGAMVVAKYPLGHRVIIKGETYIILSVFIDSW